MAVGFDMKSKFLKTFGTVWLSMLVAYTGVAWAFDDCLKDGDETVQAQSLDGIRASDSPWWSIDSFPHGPSQVKLHCPPGYYEINAVAQSSSASLTQVRKASQLKKSFLAGALTSLNDLETARRSPHMDWFVSSSPPGSLPRYLVLAVFII